METFTDRLIDKIKKKKSILVVGLDPQPKYFPEWSKKLLNDGMTSDGIRIFNQEIIKAVKPFAVAVKPNTAFYEKFGSDGIKALEITTKYAKESGLIVIEDSKRGDGGDTAETYAEGHLNSNVNNIDCMTVNPYIGDACILPFVKTLKEQNKGIFVVTKTSFKPNSRIENLVTEKRTKVWEEIAFMVNEWGEETKGEYGYKNVGAVIGATYPKEATRAREILPNSFFLIPGYGAQGGGADEAVKAVNKDGLGCIVNSSRGIIYAYKKGQFKCSEENFAEAAAKAAEFSRDELNTALKKANKLPW